MWMMILLAIGVLVVLVIGIRLVLMHPKPSHTTAKNSSKLN